MSGARFGGFVVLFLLYLTQAGRNSNPAACGDSQLFESEQYLLARIHFSRERLGADVLLYRTLHRRHRYVADPTVVESPPQVAALGGLRNVVVEIDLIETTNR